VSASHLASRSSFVGGKMLREPYDNEENAEGAALTRRHVLRGAMLAGALGLGRLPYVRVSAQETPPDEAASSRGVALQLAQRLNAVSFEQLPPLAVEHAKMIVASTLASAALGVDIESAAILRDLAKDHGGKPDAVVWFDGARLPVHEAARVNAMLSDAAASDDSDIRNTAHYGTALTSVGLAIGERVKASGRDLLTAMVIGYEAAGRLGEARVGGPPGIHASQIVAFAGAAAGARLLEATDEQFAQALGLAAFSMGGLAIGTTSWARQYMGANAAHCGAYSALVASRGYRVNDESLDGGGGWVGVYGGGNAEAVLAEREEWDIVRYLAIKLWPGAHPFSGTVEAAVNAIREAGVAPSEIARILVSGRNRTRIDGSRRPQDYSAGITSLPYFVASAVKDGDFSWAHAAPEKMFDPALHPLMDIVELDPDPPAIDYRWSWGGTVTLVTRSGERFTSTVDAPRGSGPRGIDWADVDAKFRTLMPNSGLPSQRIEEALALIHGLDRVEDVSELTRLLS
jgi:2-methylcitrate dehydratase PrpD